MAKAIPQPWVNRVMQIVEEAGAEILKVYETDFEIQTKSDGITVDASGSGGTSGHRGGPAISHPGDTDYL